MRYRLRSLALSAVARRRRSRRLAKSALSYASSKGEADCDSGSFGNLEHGGLRRRARSPLGGISIVREGLLTYLILSLIRETCAAILSAEAFEKLVCPSRAYTEGRFSAIFLIGGYVRWKCACVQGDGFSGCRLSRCSFVLDSPRVPGEYSRGIWAAECGPHIDVGLKRSWRSEDVFRIDEWTLGFGPLRIDGARRT